MPDKKLETLEDRIRALCHKVVGTSNDEELQRMCTELRTLLSQHMELVRTKLGEIKLKELQVKKELD